MFSAKTSKEGIGDLRVALHSSVLVLGLILSTVNMTLRMTLHALRMILPSLGMILTTFRMILPTLRMILPTLRMTLSTLRMAVSTVSVNALSVAWLSLGGSFLRLSGDIGGGAAGGRAVFLRRSVKFGGEEPGKVPVFQEHCLVDFFVFFRGLLTGCRLLLVIFKFEK